MTKFAELTPAQAEVAEALRAGLERCFAGKPARAAAAKAALIALVRALDPTPHTKQ